MTDDQSYGGQQPPEPPWRGSMRFQDENTQVRPPTLGEQRARQQALAQEQQNEQAVQVAEGKAATKRKILIGSGVTVGLVGLIATFYTVTAPQGTTTAVCTDNNGIVRDENDCDETYVSSHGGYHSGGFFFIPIPGGGGYNQYRYNYGGQGLVGQPVRGGSYTAPSGRTTVNTQSGKTVQRGGFGISGKSSSGGTSGTSGKSGGS